MFPVKEFFSLQGFAHACLWHDLETAWDALFYLEDYLKSFSHRIEISSIEHVYLKNEELISIGEGTTIEPGVFIQGPCVIGKNCSIRHGAYIRGSVILGDGCVVGHGSELKKAILLDGAVASHLCYVGDSILGSKVNLGAGVKCSNLRLDSREISVKFDGKKVNTGMKKLGAIIGDGGQVGCNCVLNPGTLVGKKSEIFPLLNIGGFIPPHSVVKLEKKWVIEPAFKKILQHLVGTSMDPPKKVENRSK